MRLSIHKTTGRVLLPVLVFFLAYGNFSHADTARGTPSGKPGSAVVISSPAAGAATVDRVFPVVIDFSQVSAGGAAVSFSADPELALQQPLPSSVPAGSSSLTVNVRPSANGLTFLNLFVKDDSGSRAVSIPVQVGPGGPHLEPSGGLKAGIGGSPIKLMQLP
jgi:hypothetical protein